MALYHVRVRKYYWTRTLSRYSTERVHTPVQSPFRQQGNFAAPCTVRLLSGKARLGVHVVNHDKDLSLCSGEPPYLAEAHGTIIKTSRLSCPRPIWVVQEKIKFEHPFPISIVDLSSHESMESQCMKICWVPHLEESDGTLLTILNDIPGEVQIGSTRTIRSNVVTQVPGCPQKTKAEWVEVKRLSNCRKLGEKEKEAKFNTQLESFRLNQTSTEPSGGSLQDYIRTPVQRLLTSPFRLDTLPDSIVTLDEDLEVPQLAASDWSNDDSRVGFIDLSDDDHLSDDPFERRPLSTPTRVSPTFADPDPRHRHLRDQDCPRGSEHLEHCIFTDLQPTRCFLKNHQHCHLPPAEEVQIIELDPTAITPTIPEPSSLTLVLEQSSLDPTPEQHHPGDYPVDGDEDYRSVCEWLLVPDLEARLYSPDLPGLVDRTLASPPPFMVPDLTPPCETQPATPSPSMMDINADWMRTDEEGMSLLQYGLPSTPPPSEGPFI
ncbi:hypothetical protein PG996_005686 [Apiospora saccharicola]|uniref:Uncharacterized protein n=1 Tax=Apiospora saccharicola TaxID=335842 RepID=A0ABR1VMB1_9PEZI